jgi:hypothetical protein
MTAFPASADVTAVYAGHIFRGIDMDDAAQMAEEARLAPAIADLCRRSGVRALHGALAAGADILFAEAALALGLELHVVLPFDPDAFEASSVGIGNPADAPGRWNARYRAALAAAASLRLSAASVPTGQRDAWYRTAFREAAGAALFAADRLGGSCLMMAVTDEGSSRSAGGTTSAAADWRARGRHLVTLPFGGERHTGSGDGRPRRTGLLPVVFLRPAGSEGAERIAAIRPALGERPRVLLAGDGEAVLFDLATDAIAGARLAADPSLRVVCDFGLVSAGPDAVDADAVLALPGAGDVTGTETATVVATEAFALEARFESDSVAPLFAPAAFAGGARFTTLRLFGR